jgi:undecaprenyl-diphosphatase
MNTLQAIDTQILKAIHNSLQNPVFDILMPFITFLGNSGFIWITICAGLILYKPTRRTGIMAFCALILSTVVGEWILKPLIERNRPFINMPSIELLIPNPKGFSFPSGHTSSGFAAAGVVIKTMKKTGTSLFTLASLMAFSRLYLLVHYPSDVLAGIALGLLCSMLALWFFPKFIMVIVSYKNR